MLPTKAIVPVRWTSDRFGAFVDRDLTVAAIASRPSQACAADRSVALGRETRAANSRSRYVYRCYIISLSRLGREGPHNDPIGCTINQALT